MPADVANKIETDERENAYRQHQGDEFGNMAAARGVNEPERTRAHVDLLGSRHRHELEADIERDRAAAEMERAATRRAEVQTRQEIARRKAAETRIAELKAARRRLSAGHPP